MPSLITKISQLSIHHVGGRDGGGAFALPPNFQKDAVLTFYDADVDCLEQIRERNKHLRSEVRVLPYCLGKENGEAQLHINHDPYTSSLLALNPAYRDYRAVFNDGVFGGRYDYVLGEAIGTIQKRVVPLVTLDELDARGCIGLPPDILSLDTQGTELEILIGGRRILKNVLAVMLEVEFHELYSGQSLFGGVLDLLTNEGFVFLGFTGEQAKFTPYNSPISLRGAGIQLAEDAVFIRSPESVGDDNRHASLYKLAFVALNLGQVEIACQALKLANGEASVFSLNASVSGGLEYGRFLAEFWEAAQKEMPCFPKTFAARFSYENSRLRFESADRRGVKWIEKLRDWHRQKPDRFPWLISVIKGSLAVKARLMLACRLAAAGLPFWRHPAFQWRSGVERVLAKFSLTKQMRVVRHNRLAHAVYCEHKLNPESEYKTE